MGVTKSLTQACTIPVLEISYEVWDQELEKEKMSKTDWEDYTKSKYYIKKTPKYTD